MTTQGISWEDVVEAEPGHVFYQKYEDGIQQVILRGPFHLCAYLGIPKSHPMAGHEYDNVPIPVHGGLTFAGTMPALDTIQPGLWWYGWDYGHCDDYSIWSTPIPNYHQSGTKWTPAMVEQELWSPCYDLSKLMNLAVDIAHRYMGWVKHE
jgi:hypothetical protein